MHLKTILNKYLPLKSFVYEKENFDESGEKIMVKIVPRKNSKPICSVCGQTAPGYDTLPVRYFEFIPILFFPVFFEYAKRRVECQTCGIKVEKVPWGDGKFRQTFALRIFLASWAEELPWKRVAERFQTSWQSVCRAVEWVVEYGLAHRDLSEVSAIGVDEIQYLKGHKYLTVVYQLDSNCRRLLWVGKDRTARCFNQFFSDMEEKRTGFCEEVKFVCSDMWKAFIKVAGKRIPNATHVLDRFHVRKCFSDAIEKVRRQETARLKSEGYEPVLSKSRWCFLKKPENLNKDQKTHLKDLLSKNLRTVRTYLLTEEFEHFWTYNSVTWAEKFLRQWTRKAMYSKIEPIKDVAKTLRRHEELILNWFRAKKEISNGITEGLNSNAKLAFRKARGFRSYRLAEIALFHQLGKLPKPDLGRQFW